MLLAVGILTLIPAASQAETVVGMTTQLPSAVGQQIAQFPISPQLLLKVPPIRVAIPQPGHPPLMVEVPRVAMVPLSQQRLPVHGLTDRIDFSVRLRGVAVNVFRFMV